MTGGTIGKRRAVLDGALAVFARDGYTRASIDAIADTAGVSSRTVYNHFTDKTTLFAAVVEDSASTVAAAHVDQIDRILGSIRSVADLERSLVACGLALQQVVPPDASHWGLVRHVHADAEHIPRAVVDSWRRVGPDRTRRQVALHFADLARRGLLGPTDPDIAATHYAALTGSTPTDSTPERARELMSLAVSTFLHGTLPPGGPDR